MTIHTAKPPVQVSTHRKPEASWCQQATRTTWWPSTLRTGTPGQCILSAFRWMTIHMPSKSLARQAYEMREM